MVGPRGSELDDARLGRRVVEQQLGERPDHRVGAVGASPGPLIVAAEDHPGELILELRDMPGEPGLAGFEEGGACSPAPVESDLPSVTAA